MIISIFVSNSVFAAKSTKITSKEITCYFFDKNLSEKNSIYFIGNSDVPYLSLKDCGEIFAQIKKNIIHKDDNISFDLNFTKNGEIGTLTRVDGDPYTMTVDCAEDKIIFWDYDAFVRPDERILMKDTARNLMEKFYLVKNKNFN